MMTRTSPANAGLKTQASRRHSIVLSHTTKNTGLKGKIRTNTYKGHKPNKISNIQSRE